VRPLAVKSVPEPIKAETNSLPVEFFGSFLLHFSEKYKGTFSEKLQEEVNKVLKSIYYSNLKSRKPEIFNHHETKIFVIQLMYGQYFNDAAMKHNGFCYLKAVYDHTAEYGIREYGSLPWLWHWIQSVTFAQEYLRDEPIKEVLTNLLNLLWKERAAFYLKGAWVGAHSRCLPHDVPNDENTLIDYIQFGDFPMPSSITRLEAAGFLSYQVPEPIHELAVNRLQPVEVKKRIQLVTGEEEKDSLHHYAYITSSYAIGGMWERTEEYLNEQHRWDISLPVKNNDTINQVYFFHPGDGYQEDIQDERHQSRYCEVLFHKNVVCALYHGFPNESHPFIVGFLPKGEWLQDGKNLYGRVGDVFIAIHLANPFSLIEKGRNLLVKSFGSSNGIAIEVLSEYEINSRNIHNFMEFTQYMESQTFIFELQGGDELAIQYQTTQGDQLKLEYDTLSEKVTRFIDGQPIHFDNYKLTL